MKVQTNKIIILLNLLSEQKYLMIEKHLSPRNELLYKQQPKMENCLMENINLQTWRVKASKGIGSSVVTRYTSLYSLLMKLPSFMTLQNKCRNHYVTLITKRFLSSIYLLKYIYISELPPFHLGISKLKGTNFACKGRNMNQDTWTTLAQNQYNL